MAIRMRPRSCRVACLVVATFCAWSTGQAFEVRRADARFEERQFHVELELVLDAPPTRVEAVLRDYADYPRLDPSILESTVLDRPDSETVMLFTKLRACSGIFCHTVNRVERVREGVLELTAEAVPERSDVSSGYTYTRLQSLDGRTLVRYRTSMAPKFWVPAFIARPLMLRTLRQASVDLFRHIEAHARQ